MITCGGPPDGGHSRRVASACGVGRVRLPRADAGQAAEKRCTMKEISIGDARYRIVCVERDGQWVAHAERTDNGDRFGIECGGAAEHEAFDRLKRWLDWQAEHAAALEALQVADRAYHRTIVGSAFASPTEGPSPTEMRKESLQAVDAARVLLDEVRARRPE